VTIMIYVCNSIGHFMLFVITQFTLQCATRSPCVHKLETKYCKNNSIISIAKLFPPSRPVAIPIAIEILFASIDCNPVICIVVARL